MKNLAENKQSTLNTRLVQLMKEHGLTINALAQKAGVAIGTVQKLVSDPACNPTIASVEAICNVLGISISYLLGQTEQFINSTKTHIPLLQWDTLEHDLENLAEIKLKKSSDNSSVPTTCQVSEKSFALIMTGNHMLPLFTEGTVLIFDREKPYYDGSYVLAYLSEAKKILFKQLLIDEPHLYIKSTNPMFKDNLTPLNSSDKILAILIQSQMQHQRIF